MSASGDAPCCQPGQSDQGTSCCSAPPSQSERAAGSTDGPDFRPWVVGRLATPAGPVSQVATVLHWPDRLGSWKARWGIRRMDYRVAPGLYAVRAPGPDSPVLVTANYKMTFDRLRRELAGLDVWIVVLDTKGINVWCAAGKGTFGTEELIHRVSATRLGEVVSGRTLILPQLGAPGVAAHQVRKATGFRVVYGPVRARHIPAFLATGLKATPEMRQVSFNLGERLAVAPMELVGGLKVSLAAIVALFVLAGISGEGYDLQGVWRVGTRGALLYMCAYLGGTVLTPVLLPWLPGRAFSLKGACVGAGLAAVYLLPRGPDLFAWSGGLDALAWLLIVPAVSAFFAMNFTGATPFTSPSGVRKEMRLAVPAQIAALATGVGLWLTSRFV